MAANRSRPRRTKRRPRNTAPMWKKLTVMASGPIAAFVAVEALHADRWSFVAFMALIVAVVAGVVWATAKLLGVHLSLRSWD